MKINELIKKPLSDLRKIDTNWGYSDVSDFIEKYGFERLGFGNWSDILIHPNLDYVLKLFDNADTGYIGFVKYALQNPSPYLPKFRGKLVKINKITSAIRMEKLQPNESYDDDFKTIVRYLDFHINGKVPRLSPDEARQQIVIDHEFLINDYPGLGKVLKDIAAIAIAVGKNTSDLGISNTMRRGEQLVIIDPIYGDNELLRFRN